MNSSLSRLLSHKYTKLTMLIAAIAIAPLLVSSQESVRMVYTLFDSESESNLTDMTIQLKEHHKETGKEVTITVYTAENTIERYVPPGEIELEIIADDSLTEGKDYYYASSFIIKEDTQQSLYLFPVASLRGKVVDTLENLLSNAEVAVTCDKDFISIEPVLTDRFGSFTILLVPTGNCVITASYKGESDQQELAFNRGDLEQVDLILETQSSSSSWLVILVLIIILALGGGAFYHYAHARHTTVRQQKRLKTPSSTKQELLYSRATHILPTLRERERLVVQFLLDNKGTSTQTKIRHATNIPKTSLMRVLESLKTKNIISIDTSENFKKITLTPWFLEKDRGPKSGPSP